jgi:hypothetical protein
MILISAAILAGLLYRMISPERQSPDLRSEESSPEKGVDADGFTKSGDPGFD